MTNIFDVAHYILAENNFCMATMQVHRLCFMTQCYAYHAHGRMLYPETHYMGRTAPICSELYKLHRGKYLMPNLNEYARPMINEDKQITDYVLKRFKYETGKDMARYCIDLGIATGKFEMPLVERTITNAQIKTISDTIFNR